MTDLQSELAMLTKVLEGEKEKANNLQISFLEVMELKQHEVSRVLHFQSRMGRGSHLASLCCAHCFLPSPPLSSPLLLGEQSPAAAVNCGEADV